MGEYYDISTTAEYTSGINIAISYDDNALSEDEESLILLHYNESLQEWEDITSSVDTLNNVIYGFSSTFSVFAPVVQALKPLFVSPINNGTTAINPDGPFKHGRTIPVKFHLLNIDGNIISDAEAQALTIKLDKFYKIAGSDGFPIDPGNNLPDFGDQFRYNPDDDMFIYNLRTKDGVWIANYTYGLEIITDGIKAGEFYFSLK